MNTFPEQAPIPRYATESTAEVQRSTYYDAPALNAEQLNDAAKKFIAAIESGAATTTSLNPFDYDVEKEMQSYVLVTDKVHHQEADQSAEFDGWYIGDMSHGLPHPILLLEPSRVKQKPSRYVEQEVMPGVYEVYDRQTGELVDIGGDESGE